MIFPEKLQLIRKSKGMTQEDLAAALNVSRQAVAKWESGQGYPDLSNLISISSMFNVTVDYLVKDADCQSRPVVADTESSEIDALIGFRLEANRNTYAGFSNEVEASRPLPMTTNMKKTATPISTRMSAEKSSPAKKRSSKTAALPRLYPAPLPLLHPSLRPAHSTR